MAALGRISVPLDEREIEALTKMAEADCRQPREQLRYLLRQAARHRGLFIELPAAGDEVRCQTESRMEGNGE